MSFSLTVSLQVMLATCMRFYTTGSCQAATADVHRLSGPSVSRVIKDVTDFLVRLYPEFIKMPTQQESAYVTPFL